MSTQASEWMGIQPNRSPNIDRRRSSRSNVDDSEDEFPSPSVKALKTKDYSNVSRIAECDHMTDKNWHEWKDHMLRVFLSCDIAEYVAGLIKCPDLIVDPMGTRNWDKNDVGAAGNY